jgi:hypothetical protein
MMAMIALVATVYGVSVVVLGGTALLSVYSPKVRESLIGASRPAA